MCSTCGCGDSNGGVKIKIPGKESSEHNHHAHDHDHEHNHSHNHDHDHQHSHEKTILEIEQDILSSNDMLAQRNRGFFEAENITAINLVRSYFKRS